MGIFIDLKGTTRTSFKISKATIDASGLSALRSITLPDGNINFTGGSSGQVLTLGVGGAWGPATPSGGGSTYQTFTADGVWTCPVGVTKAKIYARGIDFNNVSHAHAVTDSDVLYGWGTGGNGQGGWGSTSNQSTPTVVVGNRKFKELGRGDGFNLGIDENGDAYAWGYNQFGSLGDLSVTSRSSPVMVVGGLKFKRITGGQYHSFALRTNGDIYAWGRNNFGQLGNNATSNVSSPVAVVGGLKFKDVSGGRYFSMAVDVDGNGYGWGVDLVGQLGTGTSGNTYSSPVAVVGSLTFKMIRAFPTCDHSIGLTDDGDLYAWGDNDYGQLGIGGNPQYASFTGQITGMTSNVTITADVIGTTGNSIALAFDGSTNINTAISTWNSGNPSNTCTLTTGDGTQTPSFTPTYASFVGIPDGCSTSVTITADNAGDNGNLIQLIGDGSYDIDTIIFNWNTGNPSNTCSLTSGDGSQIPNSSADFSLSGGVSYTYINLSGGTLGLSYKSSPTLVLGSLKFKYVDVGYHTSYGITTDGDLYSWGVNNAGQLGDGTIVNRSSPTLVLGSLKFKRIGGGNNFANGETEDNKIYSFGENAVGQLGDGTTTRKSSPVAVVGGYYWHENKQRGKQVLVDTSPSTVYPVKVDELYGKFNLELIDSFVDDIVIEY